MKVSVNLRGLFAALVVGVALAWIGLPWEACLLIALLWTHALLGLLWLLERALNHWPLRQLDDWATERSRRKKALRSREALRAMRRR